MSRKKAASNAMRGARWPWGITATSVAVFVFVPVWLFWYGMNRCQELSCIGPPVNAVLMAMTIVPLLLLSWRSHGRVIYPAMLLCSEVAMVVATLRRDFDFSPQFMIAAIPAGLCVGLVFGAVSERMTPRRKDHRPS